MKYFLAVLTGVLLIGCSEERAEPGPGARSLAVAVLPDQSIDALTSRHGPLIEYLETTTSFDIELVIPRDYSDLLDQFDAGSIDLAWFGGVTFTQAEIRSQADPLVFRDIDLEFTSCYLTDSADTRSTLSEFEDEDFAFGPELSTSGHLMPRYFLEGQGMYPEQFFASIRHTAGHDETALLVRDGSVELGVANCVIVRSLFENKTLDDGNVRIMETTPLYSDYVWAANANMHERTRAVLLDAFLALDASDPEHRAILRSQGANAYMPAASGDFALVREAVRLHGLQTDKGQN